MTVSPIQKTVTFNETTNTITVASQGVAGLSAYQIAVANGFVGTEVEWLATFGGGGGGSGDMTKVVYDTTNNGVVDNAEKVNGLTVETAVPHGAVFTDTIQDLSGYTLTSDIKNDLISLDTNKPLSALQGKLLKGMVDNIVTLLNSDNVSLDTLQEIVDFIELNRATLETLSISNIAGLQTALNAKADDTDIGVTIQPYSADTTTQGNTFNGANQLVKLDATGKLPAVDGSLLTGISGGGITPNYVSGRVYYPFFTGASGAFVLNNANSAFACYTQAFSDLTITGFNINPYSVAVSFNCIIGLYTIKSDGSPNTLVVSSVVATVSTAGFYTLSCTPTLIPKGNYIIMISAQNTGTNYIKGSASGLASVINGAPINTIGDNRGFYVTKTYDGTLPSSFNVAPTFSLANIPLIGMIAQ